MAYEVIDKVKNGKLNLILFKDYYIRVKFDRSVLGLTTTGTLLSFYSPLGEKLEFYWQSEGAGINVFDNKGLRKFTMVPHTPYEITISFRRDKYYVTFRGIAKNHFKKVFIGKKSLLMRFVKGPTIGEMGQKIYYSHEKLDNRIR